VADTKPERLIAGGRSHAALPAGRVDAAVGPLHRASLHRTVDVALSLLLLLATPSIVWSQTGRWQVGTASSYSTGRYEADRPTSVVYTPTTARRLFADGDITLVFPFTCIKGDAGVTVVSGSPVRTDRGTGSTGGSTERPGAAGEATRVSTEAAPVSACGMGDIVVRGRYYVIDERNWMPTVAIRAHVKAPTASASRGLGTGRPDEGVGVEVSRSLARGFVLMADGGYTFVGKPAEARYQNTWWYDAGVSQDLANGRVNLSVFFEEYQAILPGAVSARDVLASVMLRGATGWRIQLSGQFGMSEGAPDHGLMVGASRRF
jgi:hypothetical protein